VAAIVPIGALALYVLWGNHDAFNPQTQMAAQQEHDLSPAQVNAMIEKLAAKLKNEPGNVEGWVILARTYYAMGRYEEAVPAFERATTLAPDDPRLLADYADALGAQQKSLQGKPTALVEKALKIEPTNWKALALAGTAAFDRKDYKQAVVYWEDLRKVIPPGAEMSKTIDSSIAEARGLAGMPAALASAPAAASSPASAMAAASAPATAAQSVDSTKSGSAASAKPNAAAKVEGVVKLSPELVAKASPNDLVFIFARPAEGSRMPLAIMQRAVKDLPAKFTLDDSMAMTPQMMLSSFDQVVVGARISKRGNAMPASGDLEGTSAPVKPGTSGIDVVINRTLA
jgi:cytochrome c-type biogenesis protein CcmH